MSINEKRKTVRLRFHDEENCRIEINSGGKTYNGRVYDYSRFGLGISITEEESNELHTSQIIDRCTIYAFGKTKELGTAKLVRMESQNKEVLLGIILDSEFIDMDFLLTKQALFLQEDEIKKVKMHLSVEENLSQKYIEFCSHFTFGLSLYKISLDELDSKFQNEPEKLKEALFSSLLQGIGKEFYQFLTDSMKELSAMTRNYTKLENERSGFFLRKSIFHFILESEFIKRTNLRPRGYAGDSVMMEMLYRNEYLGKSSFGRIFHKHACDTKAADAVRNRRKLINHFMNETLSKSDKKEFRILSIACGPAWEIQDFLKDSPYKHRVKIHLLDQDDEALNEAKNGILSIDNQGQPFSYEFIKESVRTILKTKSPELLFGQFDFIYSMGLYDYLTDSVAKALTMKLFSMLSERSMMIIGNYHETNETRKYMEYIMDWALYYREESSMLELLEDIQVPIHSYVDFDGSGTQMFLKVTKL